MKKLLIFAAVAAATVGAQAETLSWVGTVGGGDGTSWTVPGNWFDHTPPGAISVVAPSSGSVVQIDDDIFGNPITTWPTVGTAEQITQLVLGNESFGLLDVAGSGSLVVSGGAYIGNLGAGTLSLSDSSYFLAGNLIFGNQSVAGAVNMAGSSILHAGALTYLNGDVTSMINMTDSAWMIINGDQTGAGYENTRILASGAGESISVAYNAVDNRTEYTVIPEPATMGLFALLGGGMLWIRKRFMI